MPYSIERFIFLSLFLLILLYWCIHRESSPCKQAGRILMDAAYVGLLYNWLNRGEKLRQTLKTPLQPLWLNRGGRNTVHSRCIFSVLNAAGFLPLQHNNAFSLATFEAACIGVFVSTHVYTHCISQRPRPLRRLWLCSEEWRNRCR